MTMTTVGRGGAASGPGAVDQAGGVPVAGEDYCAGVGHSAGAAQAAGGEGGAASAVDQAGGVPVAGEDYCAGVGHGAGAAHVAGGEGGAASAIDHSARIEALAQDLAGRFELAPLLQLILSQAMTLLGCGSGSISLVDESAGTYTKMVDLGVGCREGHTFPLTEGVTGVVVRTRGTVILDEYSQVAQGHVPEDDPRWSSAVLGVPIRWGQSIVGACVMFAERGGPVFTADDARLVELFASHAAVALANAQLHADAAQRASAAAVVEERARSAREVEQTVGRALVSVLVHLDRAEENLGDDAAARVHLLAARTQTHDAIEETRRAALGLTPTALLGRSLEAAIEQELAWVRSVSSMTATLVPVGDPRALSATVRHHALRIVQEALANVVTHSRATAVRVGLVYEPGSITLLVEDDGRGFDLVEAHGDHTASMSTGCLGLHGMTSRAAAVGGALHVDTTPGWGTKVRADLPDTPARGDRTRRWEVLIASPKPIISGGLARVLPRQEPSVHIAGEVAHLSDLLEGCELLRPDVLILDPDLVTGSLAALIQDVRSSCPALAVVLLVDSPSVDQMRLATQAGVGGFLSPQADRATTARAVVAAARGETLIVPSVLGVLTQLACGDGDHPLTTREREVKQLIDEGLADKQIAAALNISVKTVEKHVGSLLRKAGVRNRTQLARLDLPGVDAG